MKAFESLELVLTKRVSYILTTKDRAPFLERTMSGIRKLKKSNDELIVIDGLSQDHTRVVISRYSDIIDLFISESDLSEGHAVNKGILISSGKYIKALTDDDVFHAEAMEQAIDIMEKNPEVDVLLCGGTKQRGEQSFPVYPSPGVNYGRQVEDIFKYGGCGIGMVIRRRAFPQFGLFNPKAVALDLDFLAQCISKGANVRFCRINLYHHPIWDHSGTVKRQEEWKADVARIQRQYGMLQSDYGSNLGRLLFQFLRRYTPPFLKNPLRGGFKRLCTLKQRGRHPQEGETSGKNPTSRVLESPIWDGGFS